MKSTSKLFYCAAITSSLFLSACGGAKDEKKEGAAETKEEPKDMWAEKCKDENGISMTIKDYKYGMSADYAYETPSFEVKNSEWNMTSDSTATLKLSNYEMKDLVGDRKDDQVDIMVNFVAKKGKKLTEGNYPYLKYDSDMYSQVNIITSKGTVWFNWFSGMPEQGSVTLNYADKDKACGKFSLSVEKPESDQIGTVRLHGNFSVGGK